MISLSSDFRVGDENKNQEEELKGLSNTELERHKFLLDFCIFLSKMIQMIHKSVHMIHISC